MNERPDMSVRGGVIGWIARHPKTVAALCLALLIAMVLFALDAKAERGLARRIAAIKANGEPTTIQDLSAMHRLPDEENLLIPLLAAAKKTQGIKMGKQDDDLPLVGLAKRIPTGCRLPAEQHDAVRFFLDQTPDARAEMHQALKMRKAELRIKWSTPAFNVLMPELSDIRHAGKVLMLEALGATDGGDRERATACLVDSFALTDFLGADAPLIAHLVQIAIHASLFDYIERTVNSCGIRSASLKEIQSRLDQLDGSPPMRQAYIVERVSFLDYMHWMRSSAPAAALGGYPEAAWRYVPALPATDIAAGMDMHNDLIDAIGPPNLETIQRVRAVETRYATLPWYCFFSRMLGGFTISRSIELWVRGIGSNRALQAALACERFRLDKGQWPGGLAYLVPKYLARVPADPIDGEPIRYAIIPEGIKTWTIAGDDHNEDNGGDVRRLEAYDSKVRPKDFGWVILNPVLRGRPATTQAATSQRH